MTTTKVSACVSLAVAGMVALSACAMWSLPCRQFRYQTINADPPSNGRNFVRR